MIGWVGPSRRTDRSIYSTRNNRACLYYEKAVFLSIKTDEARIVAASSLHSIIDNKSLVAYDTTTQLMIDLLQHKIYMYM